jgi:hypothetical protein
MLFQPKFLATGIGSMPFIDPEHAIDVSFRKIKRNKINLKLAIHYAPFQPHYNSKISLARWGLNGGRTGK